MTENLEAIKKHAGSNDCLLPQPLTIQYNILDLSKIHGNCGQKKKKIDLAKL